MFKVDDRVISPNGSHGTVLSIDGSLVRILLDGGREITGLADRCQNEDVGMITTTCPACGETLRWSLSYGEPHWVHVSVLACVQCPDVRASDGLPAPASVTA